MDDEDLTPAERFEAARARNTEKRRQLHAFRGLYEFGLDAFQVRACEGLEAGRGVLVAAPTGAGKTIVGEFAAHLALAEGTKCFYTTPIKALSNQKYHDLVARYGTDKVGLLTGDNTVNGEADVVVMTTEVLRNMLYAGSDTLDRLAYVVMDEVHYLADRSRGAVWEEVIIHLPDRVGVVALSATVSNAEEFGDWLSAVRGDTLVVVEEHRPVPLWQHVMAARTVHDLFIDDAQEEVNPELVRLARDDMHAARSRGHRPGRGNHRSQGAHAPGRVEAIRRLDAEGLLPAIFFVFSRNGCDVAVEQAMWAGIRLTSAEERELIHSIVEERCRDIPTRDLGVLGYDAWLDALSRGVAAHHAGMLPAFKEIVEDLFQRGLVRVVFATETLALGINMPARTVVLEKLTKWNGETHADITPGEYTQLTGRAGRRGIDVEGHAVVLWHAGLDPRSLAGLASTRTYPLRSSFRPSYNMAVNLVGSMGSHAAREVLETSFAQFQADRGVVGLARQIRKQEEALEGYHGAMHCHLGDFAEYAGMRRALSDRERELTRLGAAKRRTDAIRSLERLKTGDIIVVPSGRRSGPVVVLDPGIDPTGKDDPRPLILTRDRQAKRLSAADFPTPVAPLERLRIPKGFRHQSSNARKDLAAALGEKTRGVALPKPHRDRSRAADDVEIQRLRAAIRRHPCHGCDDREDHARWAERYYRLRSETEGLARKVEGRTNTIARQFDSVCEVLSHLGYLTEPGEGASVTSAGAALARLYSESDLLAAECLRSGLWDGLNEPELAAACAALVYEARGGQGGPPAIPKGPIEEVLSKMLELWAGLEELEKEHRIFLIREPDLGFCMAAYRWASGARLEAVLRDGAMTAGDFVRWSKQVVDLLGQVADAAAGTPLSATARRTADRFARGVVAYTSVGGSSAETPTSSLGERRDVT